MLLALSFACTLFSWYPTTAWSQFPTHQWSQRFGGDDRTCDEGLGVAVDAAGNVLVTGFFVDAVDFGGGPLACEGFSDIFIAKYDAFGAHLWSRRFGDAGFFSSGLAVAADNDGSVLATGRFGGTVDFGGGPLTSQGYSDAFVAKYNADGVHLWSERFGDIYTDCGSDIAVDGGGNIVVTGQFRGTVDFGGGPLTSAGDHDVFVARYDGAGVHLWSRRFGGELMDLSEAVAIDGGGNIVVTGSFQDSSDFGGGPLGSAGYHDIFLAKYDAGGTHLWSARFGDTVNDYGRDVAVDGAGNVLVTGEFRGIVNFGGVPLSSAGNEDIFLAKLNAGGGHVWSRRFGDASHAQAGFAVAADGDDNIVLTGWFWGSVDLGGGTLFSAGEKDIFVARYDAGGDHLGSQRFGDTGWEAGFDVATDGAGGTILTGAYEVSIDFGGGELVNPGGANFGCTDICLAKFGLPVPPRRRTPIPIQLMSVATRSVPYLHALEQNAPNPFNPVTRISFDLPEESHVSLVVFDVSGEKVAVVLNERKAAGTHTVSFQGEDLPSGVYFYRLVAGKYRAVKRMILVK
jgi:hypothetical protein